MSESEKNISFVEDNINCELSFENNELPIEEKEIFVKAAVEKIMNIYWPDPASEFYCRICNYLEFDSDEALTKHNETDDHKWRLGNETTLFCLICQVHTYNHQIKEKHEKGKRHKKLQNLFDEAEHNAKVFWDVEKQEKDDRENMVEENIKFVEEEDDELDKDCNENSQPFQHESLEENYLEHADKFKEECELMRLKMKEFFDKKYRYSGVVDASFVQAAIRHSMKTYFPDIESKLYCPVCNFVMFKNKMNKRRHMLTESHLAYVAAMKLFYCKACKKNHLTEGSFRKHLDDERHKKLRCLLYVCKFEAMVLTEASKKAKVDFETMSKRLYPEGGLIQDDSYCLVCTHEIKNGAKMHAKNNKKHLHNFTRLIQRLKKKTLAFKDGCALCQVSKKDDSSYNIDEHVKNVEHTRKFALYEKSLGIIDADGVKGIFSGAKRKFKKTCDEKSQVKSEEVSKKDDSSATSVIVVSDDEQGISNNSSSNKTQSKNLKGILKNKKSFANHDEIPLAKKQKQDQPPSQLGLNVSKFIIPKKPRRQIDRFGSTKPSNSFDRGEQRISPIDHPRLYPMPEPIQRSLHQIPYRMESDRHEKHSQEFRNRPPSNVQGGILYNRDPNPNRFDHLDPVSFSWRHRQDIGYGEMRNPQPGFQRINRNDTRNLRFDDLRQARRFHNL